MKSVPFNQSRMVTREIQSDIETVGRNTALFEEANFDSRADALDFLEFHVLDRIDGLLQTINPPAGLLPLKRDAENIKSRLEAIDRDLFQQLRASIRSGHCRGATFLDLVTAYIGRSSDSPSSSQRIGYDNLDVFINGLLSALSIPQESREREPEMVYFQKTPVRIIFELAAKVHLSKEDVFYDLGSGLGQVSILMHLLTGATAKGVELEPAFCRYANDCASNLNLKQVTFIQADARTADYSEGTVFFLYTPFEGQILQEVLEKLRVESQNRRITLFTYGPCTLHLAQQNWLECADPTNQHIYTLAEFRSAPL